MHGRFSKRIEEALGKLDGRLARSRKHLERGPIERQIGRLLGRNSRAAGRYKIRVVTDGRRTSGLRVRWATVPAWEEWAQYSEGTYILRTNVRDWTSESLWRTYIQLGQAEAAFRIHKSELSLRPVWHQTRRARSCAHPGLLPRLRALADAIRCVVRPDKAQAMLLDRLGLRLPERLRIPPPMREM